MRFADDLLVVCKSRQQAQAALTRLRALLANLGLVPKEAKTRIVELAVDGIMKAFSSGHSPPKEAIAIADAVCGLAGCPPVPDWLHSLEKQIAAGQLTRRRGRAHSH